MNSNIDYNDGYEYPSRSTQYLTDLLYFEYDHLKDFIKNHLDGEDYYHQWYAIVSFILFVVNIVHRSTDYSGRRIIENAILDYIRNEKNPRSFLNFFNDEVEAKEVGMNRSLKDYVHNYDSQLLSLSVEEMYYHFLHTWDNSEKKYQPENVSYAFGLIMKSFSNISKDKISS